eukprot:scaffold13283_cov71-Skeletonema_marinoi.AAC.8
MTERAMNKMGIFTNLSTIQKSSNSAKSSLQSPLPGRLSRSYTVRCSIIVPYNTKWIWNMLWLAAKTSSR